MFLDKTLSVKLQKKLAACYQNANCQIFHGIAHEDYFVTDEVVDYVKKTILQTSSE